MPASVKDRFRVGLTGGVGSGKTLVAAELARLGAHVIDTDEIARELTAPGGAAIAAIRARFGADFVDAHGALDRARMRDLVFRTPAARLELEQILHPMIRAATETRAADVSDVASYVVLVIPLLIESGMWRTRVDRVLVIDCSVQTQVMRVMQRSGLNEVTVRAIIAAQAARPERLDAADDVLVNEGSAELALRRAARLHAFYEHFASRARASVASGSL